MAPNRIAGQLRFQGEAHILVPAVEHGRDLVTVEPGCDEGTPWVTLELRQERAILAEPQEELGQAGLLCRVGHSRGPYDHRGSKVNAAALCAAGPEL